MRLWPVLGIPGARQTGKSTLLRDQIAHKTKANYCTLDHKEVRIQADKSPALFLASTDAKTLIIDEVQKVPDLFDAIKVEVDEDRRPGRYLISGSTQFSRKVGIRESLTGRIGLIQLHPMTLAETLGYDFAKPWVDGKIQHYFSEKDVLKRLDCGGMPGMCFLRAAEERQATMESWLETTCYRDLQQIRGARLSGDLAYDLLTTIATLDHATIPELASRLRQDPRRIRTHLDALETLFVINRIEPHPLGHGKAKYFLLDSGIAAHLGASLPVKLITWILNECLAQFSYSGKPMRLYHYRSLNRSTVDLVLAIDKKLHAIIITDEQGVGTYLMRTAEAFLKKAPQAQVSILAPVKSSYLAGKKIHVLPWGKMG
jgi:predicted AAA+ superfamily ATPase